MHCSRHKFRQIPISYEVCAFNLIRAVSAWSKLLFLLITQPVIANAPHTHTHARTQRQSCSSKGRRRTLTQHLRDWQRDYQSLPLFKMTTRLVKHSILSGQTVRAAGPVTRITTEHHTLRVSNFLQATVFGEKSWLWNVQRTAALYDCSLLMPRQ